VPVFYDTRRGAEKAAKSEEIRWSELVAGAVLPAPAG